MESVAYVKQLVEFLKSPVLIRKPLKKVCYHDLLILFLVGTGCNVLFGFVDELRILQRTLGYSRNVVDAALATHSFLYCLFMICLLPGILEELIGRYYLNKTYGNIIYVFFNLLVIVSTLINLQISLLIPYIGFLLISVGYLFYVSRYSFRGNYRLNKFLSKYYSYLFYISAIAFGTLHITNYKMSHQLMVLPVLLVLPQIALGCLFAYTRLKYGLLYGMLLHFSNNLLSVCLYFLIKRMF